VRTPAIAFRYTFCCDSFVPADVRKPALEVLRNEDLPELQGRERRLFEFLQALPRAL